MASSGGGTAKELPLLKDVGVAKREELFVKKVQLCTMVYRFDSDLALQLAGGAGGPAVQMGNPDTGGKEMKRQTLMELLDFVNTQARDFFFFSCDKNFGSPFIAELFLRE